jgi:hypothetical protein
MPARSITTSQKPTGKWHGAHHPWLYGTRCFRWNGSDIIGANFVPLATEMRAWMLRKGRLFVPADAWTEVGGYTNPYSISGASLGLILGRVINSCHDYVNSEAEGDDEVDAEVERLRIHNECVLYAARFCEVVIKQLLYCTQVPSNRFQRMALGALLESPCPSCKKSNGKVPHSVSMVGTLAHPFHLCLEFEQCAMDHMQLVNFQRNAEAAHSDIQRLNVRSVAESKAQLEKDCHQVMSDFLHLLSHLETLEQRMLDDLATKGDAIMLLKRNGLAPEDCNFALAPGQRVGKPVLRSSLKAAST